MRSQERRPPVAVASLHHPEQGGQIGLEPVNGYDRGELACIAVVAAQGFASHGDDMLGVGATPGVEPEREVTVIHDDDSDDGGGGVEKGGPGAAGGEALADLEEELFGNIDDL